MIPITEWSIYWETAAAIGIVAISALLAWAVHAALGVLLRRVTAKTATSLVEVLVKELRGPLFLLILVSGLWLGLSSVSHLRPFAPQLAIAWRLLALILGIWALGRLVDGLPSFEKSVSRATGVGEAKLLVPLLRRVLKGIILVLGTVLILGNMGIQISPLLAGLGITGLAVALGLQPTLSNFFAGTYLVTGRVLKSGDFVEIEGGARGYVIEVGWRSTRIRTPANTMVVIPNARVAESVLTTYPGTGEGYGVLVESRVSYGSDLAEVRRIAMEVMSEIIAEFPEADKTFAPWFGFEGFGESNIDFWLWLQAKDRGSSFVIKTELIMRLKARFAKEGVEINYPTRALRLHDSIASKLH